jgi:hypothetical protein
MGEILPEIFDKGIEKIIKHAQSIQQPRSNFQLEKFVIGQHETSQMQFYQTCIEIIEGYFNLKIAKLEVEKMKIREHALRNSSDPIDQIDAQIISLGISKTESVIKGSENELARLVDLYNSFPIKYTRQDIELDQDVYWAERLQRQAALEQVSVSTSQSEHFNSLRQVGLLNVSKGVISLDGPTP